MSTYHYALFTKYKINQLRLRVVFYQWVRTLQPYISLKINVSRSAQYYSFFATHNLNI